MRFLVTGSAGFIGFHVTRRLVSAGHEVTGLDAMVGGPGADLRRERLKMLEVAGGFSGVIGRLEDPFTLTRAMQPGAPEVIIHLAAQAGVRASLDDPAAFVASNLAGTAAVLELARQVRPKHFIHASTSSVYGDSSRETFSESDPTDQPVSFYAATKKGAEALGHSYAHLFKLPVTVLRFFTVYGPWGRPDMAYYKFTKAIAAGEPIDVYGGGTQERDFTFVDDLAWAIASLVDRPPVMGEPVIAAGISDSLSPVAPYRVLNIGGGRPVQLNRLIDLIEQAVGKKARRRALPAQPGDVPRTHASPALIKALTGFEAKTPLEEGVPAFVDWYRSYAR